MDIEDKIRKQIISLTDIPTHILIKHFSGKATTHNAANILLIATPGDYKNHIEKMIKSFNEKHNQGTIMINQAFKDIVSGIESIEEEKVIKTQEEEITLSPRYSRGIAYMPSQTNCLSDEEDVKFDQTVSSTLLSDKHMSVYGQSKEQTDNKEESIYTPKTLSKMKSKQQKKKLFKSNSLLNNMLKRV